MKVVRFLTTIMAVATLGFVACRKTEPTKADAPVSPAPMDRLQSDVRLDAPQRQEPEPAAKRRLLERLGSEEGKN